MKVSIRSALIGGFVGLQVVPALVIMLSTYWVSERVLLEHAKAIMENIATFTIYQAQGYLNPAQDAAMLTQRLADSDVVSSRNRPALERYFYEQLALHSNFAGIYLGTPDGGFIYVSRNAQHDPGGFRTKVITVKDGRRTVELVWRDAAQRETGRELAPDDPYDPRKRPWYVQALAARDTVWTGPYIFFTSQKPGLTAASPAFGKGGELTGVVGVDIEIEEISNFLTQMRVGKHGRAFILGRNGDVVAFPDPSKIKRPTESGSGALRLTKISELDDVLSRKAFASLGIPIERFSVPEPVFGSFDHEGKTYYTMFAPFESDQWPWVIGIYIPEDDYLAPLKRNRSFTIAVVLGVAGLATVVGLGIARSVVRPMVAFQAEAAAVRGGDLETSFDKGSVIKEIQDTADSFTRMKEGLKETRARNTQLTRGLEAHARELERKEMHLRATLSSLVNFSDALVILDREGTVRFLNPAAEDLLGNGRADLLGQPFPYPVAEKGVSEVRLPRAGQGGTAVAEMRVVSIEWEGQPALLVALRDITERRRMEGEIRWRAEALEALHETALDLVARRELPDLLRAIAVRAANLVGAKGAGVLLVRDGALEASLWHGLGEVAVGTRLEPGEGVAGSVWARGEPLVVDDYEQWAGRSPKLAVPGVRSWVGAPILWGGSPLGVLLVGDDRPGRFGPEDAALLARFAPLAAAALEQRRMLEEAEVLYARARKDAETRAVLLKEVNHRVKNNLSSIIGLLYAELQHAQAASDPAYRDALQGLVVRVQGLATVHGLLTETEWGPVPVTELAEGVMRSVFQGLGPERRVDVRVERSPVRVSAAQANTLAMVINEMATNTVKHGGAAAGRPCSVRVSIGTEEDGWVRIVYRDDGPGFPEDVIDGSRYGTGLYLVRSLVAGDLRGEVSLTNDGGGVIAVRFAVSERVQQGQRDG